MFKLAAEKRHRSSQRTYSVQLNMGCRSHKTLHTTTATILWPLYRSARVSRHLPSPDHTRRRPPGRPQNKWLDQLRNNSTRPTGELWRRAVDRGHGGAMTRWPSPATRPWTAYAPRIKYDFNKRHFIACLLFYYV